MRNSYCFGKAAAATGTAMADIMQTELAKLAALSAAAPPPETQKPGASLLAEARNPKRFSEADVSVSEQDIKEYRKGKSLADDPMASYLHKEQAATPKKQHKAH